MNSINGQKPKYAAVLFDLDGTLIDTAPDFIYCLNTLLIENKCEPIADTLIRSHVSHGSGALIKLGFNIDESNSEFRTLQQALLDLYAKNLCRKSQLFPPLERTLMQLEKQYTPWGIVTNKPRQYAEPLLQGLKLFDRCGVLVCPDDVSKPKPHPEALQLACKYLNVNTVDSVYIGDHERDIEAGRAANMTTITAAFGYLEKDSDIHSWQADFVCEHASKLGSLIV